MQQERKASRGCIWVLIAGAIVILLFFVGLFGLLLTGERVSAPSVGKMGEDELPRLREIWSAGEGDVKVVRIPLEGLIMLGEGSGLLLPGAGSTEHTLRAIRRATNDPEIRAIILEIDSGGGGITASDILFTALENFRKARPGRKVVALLGDVAASGAYYVALAADYVIAHPTTITGSIGVLIQTLNFRELGEKIGVKDVTIKSGVNKDILNPFGEVSPEQRKLLQELVDEMHSRFVKLVVERRGLPEGKVREIADGRIFSATHAVEMDLVDQIGYWEDAMKKTAELLGVEKVRVYRYAGRFSVAELLRLVMPWNSVRTILENTAQPRLLYLWHL
ncbi:MAG: signal peptide peptidase SppA [Kiritimatiellae bacterium]|nr:signal peptide peptidase SppA [Kiritimatiellia bacterium]